MTAFAATLDELADADLLVHVIDCANTAFEAQMEAVEKLLEELGLGQTPMLRVFNKKDLITSETAENLCDRVQWSCHISDRFQDFSSPDQTNGRRDSHDSIRLYVRRKGFTGCALSGNVLMTVSSKDHTRNLTVAISLLAGLTLLGALLAYLGHLGPMLEKLCKAFQGRDEMRAYVESCGTWAPAAFIFLQSAQVVVAPIPGELTGAVRGFVFGRRSRARYILRPA